MDVKLIALALYLVTMSATQAISTAQAEGVFQWHSSNVQLLRGHDYELGEQERSIVTFEHANGWKYGDTYAWADLIYPDGQGRSYYGEISPRLSLTKLTEQSFSYGIIKDILVSTTFEKARGQKLQYLYGGAIDLDLPGFKFFKTNAYIHDSKELDGHTWQITLAWNRPFEINGIRFLAEGFTDIQGGEGGREPNQLVVPRFLVDVSDLLGRRPGKLMAGVEYQYWRNKFGIDGVTESALQAQVKWKF